MSRRELSLIAIGALLGAAALAPLRAQDADPQADLEAWAALARPGDAHRRLDALVGTFDAASKVWHDPVAAPTEMTGLTVNAWALGGRFLESHAFGSAPGGQSFEGRGYTGFDNATGAYVSIWLDTMSTAPLVTRGELDGRTITFRGVAHGPGGAVMKYRHTLEVVSGDRHVFTLWQAMGDGPEVKIVETTYSRR